MSKEAETLRLKKRALSDRVRIAKMEIDAGNYNAGADHLTQALADCKALAPEIAASEPTQGKLPV